MNSLRIAMFSALLPSPHRKVCGANLAAHRLANELSKSNDVTMFSLSDRPVDALYHHKKLFPRLKWLSSPGPRLLLLPFLINSLDFKKFDLLHLHGNDWFYVRRTCPTVRTMHGSSLRESQTATSFKRRFACRLVYYLEHISTWLATLALAVGKDTANIYGIQQVIDNGVDLSVFYPGPKTPEPSILYVGTWKGRKRGQFLARLFLNTVLKEMPNARLCMVTDYCTSNASIRHEVSPTDDILAQRYREAWLFAYPSLYEGFGICYLESLASSTAILSSRNDGAEYVLEAGRYGVLVDDSSFASNLLELLQNKEKRLALERDGRDRAAQFTWGSIAARHETLYRQAIRIFNNGIK